MRAPFQVLIIPYRKHENEFQFFILKRSDDKYWQWIAGGGEDNETPNEAAIRETFEEIGLRKTELIKLESVCSIPVSHFPDLKLNANILTIPEFSFGVEIIKGEEIILSDEHDEFKWVNYAEAERSLKWESNRKALKELMTVIQ